MIGKAMMHKRFEEVKYYDAWRWWHVRSLKSYGSLVVSLLLAVSSFNILVIYPASFLWTPPYPSGFWGENSIPVASFTFTATASKWASVSASVKFKGMFEALVYGGAVGKYETKAYLYVFDNTIGQGASYLMNGIPNDYSKEITAAGALQLPVDDTLTLTAGFTATQGHQYQITIELYLTATAVASAGHAHVSILFYSTGQPSWSIKINSIYLSY